MKSTIINAALAASAVSLVTASSLSRDQNRVLAQRRALNRFQRVRLDRREVAGVSYLAVANASDPTVVPASADPIAVANATVVSEPTWIEGTALWFAQDGVTEGACKQVHTDEDLVIGLSTAYINSWSTISPYCGQSVYVEDLSSGKNLTLLVTDSSGNDYTTLSKAAFGYFAPLTTGEVKIRYHFLDAAATNTTASSGNSTVSSDAQTTSSRVGPTKPVATDAVPTSKPTPQPTVTTPSVNEEQASSSSASVAAAEAAAASSSSQAAAAAAASSKSVAAAQAQASADAAAAAAKKQAQQDAQKAAAAKQAQEEQAAAAAAQAAADKAAAEKAAAKAVEQKNAEQQAAADKAAEQLAAQQQAAQAATQAKQAQSSGTGAVVTGGFATYFLQGGNPGNCGAVSQDSDKVIALPTATYAGGSHCGAMIRITRTDTGATVVARVADSCPTCVNNQSLDLSVGAFTALATESEGMVPISWEWA